MFIHLWPSHKYLTSTIMWLENHKANCCISWRIKHFKQCSASQSSHFDFIIKSKAFMKWILGMNLQTSELFHELHHLTLYFPNSIIGKLNFSSNSGWTPWRQSQKYIFCWVTMSISLSMDMEIIMLVWISTNVMLVTRMSVTNWFIVKPKLY